LQHYAAGLLVTSCSVIGPSMLCAVGERSAIALDIYTDRRYSARDSGSL